jgi:hypothetical protein
MSSSFRYYRSAAADIDRGWLQHHYRNDEGDKCPLEALSVSFGTIAPGVAVLPVRVMNEVDDYFSRYPYYRFRRRLRRMLGIMDWSVKKGALIAWNDVWWRRKSRVVKALYGVAERYEAGWIYEENQRLVAEVDRLRQLLEQQQNRMRQLGAENRRLKSRTYVRTMRAERTQLQELERHLARTWEELTEFSTFAVQ